MFINISNHPSSRWSEAQLSAAKALGCGDVWDIAFPNVPPGASPDEVTTLAFTTIGKCSDLLHSRWEEPRIFMVQGEFSLTYKITSLLHFVKEVVVVACSERKTVERQLEDGKTSKEAVFEFVQFRKV